MCLYFLNSAVIANSKMDYSLNVKTKAWQVNLPFTNMTLAGSYQKKKQQQPYQYKMLLHRNIYRLWPV